MPCPVCNRTYLVTIGVSLGEAQMTLRSCSRCDIRWWERDGKSVSLTGVLDLAAAHR